MKKFDYDLLLTLLDKYGEVLINESRLENLDLLLKLTLIIYRELGGMRMKYKAINVAFNHNDAKSLKMLKKEYKEDLKFYYENGENAFMKEYPLFKEENIELYLKCAIKLCNLYIKILKEKSALNVWNFYTNFTHNEFIYVFLFNSSSHSFI